MGSSHSFFINKCSNTTGPSIFGHRLKVQLEVLGWTFAKCADYNICFSAGKKAEASVNILRLDGMYYDTENTIGNTDKLNAPIYEAYSSFDKLVFQSEYGKLLFFSHFGETRKPYAVIHNGVPSTFSPEGDLYKYPWAKTLICSASWRAHKRLSTIIEGFKLFYGNSIGLVVLGKCEEQIQVDNVLYLGNIAPNRLPFYLRGADAFVHLTWLDCCPNSVIEALACGLPVLCSHNGGTQELVKRDGVVLQLEEDYLFGKVPLYKPPIGDPVIVYRGMQDILSWGKKRVCRPEFLIERVAKEYMLSFI